MLSAKRLGYWCFALVLVAVAGVEGHADDRSAAEILPGSTVLYLEISRPTEVVASILEHPLTRRIQQLDVYTAALQDQKAKQFQVGVKLVEAQLGLSWQKALDVLAADGIVMAFDAPTQAVCILAKSRDGAALEKLRQDAVRLARQDAQNKGKNDPFTEKDYRGITAYDTGEGGFATYGEWLVITNKGELGKKLLDALLDGADDNLAANQHFQRARGLARSSSAWGYVNIEVLRTALNGKGLFATKTDNPVAELLAGGILDALQHTPYLTASLSLSDAELSIKAGMPLQREWISEAREHYFGPGGTGSAPEVRDVPDTLFTLAAYRDVSAMWLRAGDLFDEKVNDQLAQADSTLAVIFSGKDFGEEILGALSPQLQIVAVRQPFPDTAPIPAIKLPAFALVGELKDPETLTPEFRRIFQSLIGFLNVVGAQNGNPQMQLGGEPLPDGELVTATFVPRVGQDANAQAPIHFNFSPSIAFSGNLMVVSSTAELARELAGSTAGRSDPSVNTAAGLNASVLRAVLDDNHTHLVSQTMLKEGRSREEAELQVATLLELLELLKDASLRLTTSDSSVNLDISVRFSDAGGN